MKVDHISVVRILEPNVFEDDRGFFFESWNRQALQAVGIDVDFVQDNHSLSRKTHTLRGLHFQKPPFAQDKLVRVLRGRILDVVVDIRIGSPTFGQHMAVQLSAENKKQILVPKGFAHGLLTLEPDTEILYKVSDHYAPDCDLGIAWNDPRLAIDWGLPAGQSPTLSNKDQALPLLLDLPDYFLYQE